MVSGTLDSYTPYRDQIREEFRSGRLVCPKGPSFYGPFDKHGHLPDKGDDTTSLRAGALRESNTRSLSPTAATIFQHILREDASRKFLELGAGAGKAAFDAWRLAEAHQADLQIHTVSRTPVSPYFGLERTVIEVIRNFPDDILEKATGDLRELIQQTLKSKSGGTPYYRLRLDAALALSELLNERIFRVLSEPFIERQYVGDFDNLELEQGAYDLVYQNYAVLADRDLAVTLRKTLQLLSKDGVFVWAGLDNQGVFTDCRGNNIDLGDFICLYGPEQDDSEESTALFFHKDSQLAAQLPPLSTASSKQVDGGVTLV